MKHSHLLALSCGALLILPACISTIPSCRWLPMMKKKENHSKTLSKIITISTEEDFTKKVLESKKPVMVKFSAKWCSACKVMNPRVKEIAEELYPDYIIAEVDVDGLQTLATKYLVKGIPAFLFFKNGKQINKNTNIIGVIEKDKLINHLSKAFAE